MTDSTDPVRGHIVISLISRDRGAHSPHVVESRDLISTDDSNELPEGYEAEFH